jgi:hypothetical protein
LAALAVMNSASEASIDLRPQPPSRNPGRFPTNPAPDRHLRRRLDRRMTRITQPIARAAFPIAGLYDPNAEKAKALAPKNGVSRLSLPSRKPRPCPARSSISPPRRRPMPPCSWPLCPDGVCGADPEADGQRSLGGHRDPEHLPRKKGLKAAVNFQLRFAPMLLALKDAIAKGLLGEVVDFDVAIWRSTRRGASGPSSRACRASRSPCTRSIIST